jgi:hypothetical protein
MCRPVEAICNAELYARMFNLKSLVAGDKGWCSLGTLVSKSLMAEVQGRGKHYSTQTSYHRHNTKWCAFSRAESGVHCSVCTYVTWHPISVPPTPPPHPQCAGLASQLAGREPLV